MQPEELKKIALNISTPSIYEDELHKLLTDLKLDPDKIIEEMLKAGILERDIVEGKFNVKHDNSA